ncbi:prolyl oligopeptidase family serine peptidase [Nocardia otitidiscaviarum]|uniref:prolyl oligopeptidase family serine peptidase n=1 Tax=Nocardia otitidiscaviarum TaxID=1823 RepID=UPI0018945D15|nr:prolyl oligopeptidase family serine peptidase [Nocardia otitidiscaviarum]MBF6177743.1 S9 family peptidase [Nocardia otitidiscaviarum]
MGGVGRWLRTALAAVVVAVIAACGTADGAQDPHLWLEELDSPRVRQWVADQNARTLDVLERHPDFPGNLAVARELGNSPDRIPVPRLEHGRVGNFWQDAEHPRGIWRETTRADYESPQPHWTTVLDLDAVARADGKNWVWKGIDCDPIRHTRCLVRLSEGGEDAVTVREFDRTTGAFVDNGFALPRGKQYVAWLDLDTLLVSREWRPGEVTASGYPYIVKQLRRGQPLDAAVEVLRGDPADELATQPVLLEDGAGGRMSLIRRGTTFFEHEVSRFDGRAPELLGIPPKHDLEGLIGDRLLIGLRQDWTVAGVTHAAGSLLSLRVAELTADPSRMRPVPVYVPGPREALGSVLVTRDRIVVTSLDDVRGRATVHTPLPDGTWSAAPVPVPENATVEAVDADAAGDIAYLSVTSFLTPTTLLSLDTASGVATPVKMAPARFDSSRYVVEQRKTTSPDGTRVPYFVVRPAGMAFDGTNPTVLSAYGGFGSVSTPGYDGVLGRLWLERGGVYVLANIRGGGEYGPRWHEAARGVHRQRAYDDFAAVAQDLIARGITTPRHLGIQGGSNGGLLVGVQLVQRPHLWNAVDIAVPLLDMLRYEEIAAGASWVDEYGTVADPEQRAFLASISPYAQLKPGVVYPEPLVWTNTTDDRVGPQHARKFAARLAEQGHPYLFYEATRGGHGGGSNNDERAYTTALEYTYFQRQLG